MKFDRQRSVVKAIMMYNTLFIFIRTSNFRAEAERSYFYAI